MSCRACGERIEIALEEEHSGSPTDEYSIANRTVIESVENAPPPVVRGRKRARASERAPVDRKPSRWLPALAVGAVVVALLGVACLWAGAKAAGIVLIAALFTLVPLARFFILDHIYRARIHDQLEALRCSVTRISWRPLQGLLFDRGWKRRRRFRFYEVEYSEQNGVKKTELCAIGFWIGPLWGDEIDSFGGSSDLQSGRAALLPYLGVGGLLIIAGTATITELRYAISGRIVQGKITRVTEINSPKDRRGQPQTSKSRIEYEFTEADGTIRRESVVKTALGMLARGQQPIQVEYVPGSKGWSRFAGETRLVWVYVLAGVVVLLAAVKLLDHFDTFGLRRQRE